MKKFNERVIKFKYNKEKDKKIISIINPIYEMSIGKNIDKVKLINIKNYFESKTKTSNFSSIKLFGKNYRKKKI